MACIVYDPAADARGFRMKLRSSQKWAIGAVALAILIACSPRAPEKPFQPAPSAPTLAP
jgi:hypothetical protein